mmetsp:Transcript_16190/g.39580  ORF Transcript_16190/g.39580 Transcript_16190/m.39580 type:complete len:207 (-) Transcript_16190:691-1311(-)
MPLLIGLVFLEFGAPIQSLVDSNLFQGFQNTRHHTLESTKVNVCSIVKSVHQIIGTFRQNILDVQLATLFVLHFSRNGIGDFQTTRRRSLLHGGKFLGIQQTARDGNSQNEPGSCLKLMTGNGFFHEQSMQKGSKGSNTSTSGDHDDIRRGIFWKQHGLADGTSYLECSSWLGVAQEIGTDTLFGWIDESSGWIEIFGPTNTKTDS